MSNDVRSATRYAIELPAQVVVGGQSHPARVQNICRDAALLHSASACAVGQEVLLLLDLPMGEPIRVEGTVIRLAEAPPGEHAFAVLFSGHDPAAVTEIEMFLARVADGQFG